MYTYPEVTLTGLLIGGEAPIVDRPITVVEGSNASGSYLHRGTVLGVITASGKYTTAISTATDGSETPKAILAVSVDSSTADVECPAYFEGSFADVGLTFGAGITAMTANETFTAAGTAIFIRPVGSFSVDVE